MNGTVTAQFDLPAGYTYDSGAVLVTPLSSTPVDASKVTANKNRIILQFDATEVDNNVPTGEASLTVRVNALNPQGVQEQLTSTAAVTVVK